MSIPIRCFTCGKVLGNKHERFLSYNDKEKAFKDLNITRYCCKTILLTTIDTESFFQNYTNFPDNIQLKQEHTVRIYNAR